MTNAAGTDESCSIINVTYIIINMTNASRPRAGFLLPISRSVSAPMWRPSMNLAAMSLQSNLSQFLLTVLGGVHAHGRHLWACRQNIVFVMRHVSQASQHLSIRPSNKNTLQSAIQKDNPWNPQYFCHGMMSSVWCHNIKMRCIRRYDEHRRSGWGTGCKNESEKGRRGVQM